MTVPHVQFTREQLERELKRVEAHARRALGAESTMKEAKEAELFDLPREGGISRLQFTCPHCGQNVQFSEMLAAFVVAVKVEPCAVLGRHQWSPVPRKGETRRSA